MYLQGLVEVSVRDGMRNIRFCEVMNEMTAHRFLILPTRIFFCKGRLFPPNVKSLTENLPQTS